MPDHLRDAHYKWAARLKRGEGYRYPPDFEGGYVPHAYLPEGRRYYNPTDRVLEKRIKERLEFWRREFEGRQA